MNSSYLNLVNVDFVQLTMIVDALLIFVSDFHLYHGFDQVINVVVIRVYLLMHCPDSNYLVSRVFHLRHHRQLVRLVIELVVILVYSLMVDTIHRMQLLDVAISVNVAVPG